MVSFILIINQDAFLCNVFLIYKLDVFLIFVNKNTNTDGILFFDFVNVSNITGNFIPLKSSFLANLLLAFVILAGLRSGGFKCLTKHHLKHSLSSTFSILINPFLGWLVLSVILYNCYQLNEYYLKC